MKNLQTFADCNMPLHKNVCVPHWWLLQTLRTH